MLRTLYVPVGWGRTAGIALILFTWTIYPSGHTESALCFLLPTSKILELFALKEISNIYNVSQPAHFAENAKSIHQKTQESSLQDFEF